MLTVGALLRRLSASVAVLRLLTYVPLAAIVTLVAAITSIRGE